MTDTMLKATTPNKATTPRNQTNPLTMSPIALITGASRGLGRSMAFHLADSSVDIIGTYFNNADAAQEAVREIEERGARATMLQLDIGQTATFRAFSEAVCEALDETFSGRQINYLVNNAGHGFNSAFTDTTEEEFDRLAAVQYKGPYFLTQRLLPLLAQGGRVLFVSSGLTRFSVPGYSAYASAKGAIEIVARYLAAELAERQIRVNVVAPGVAETDFAGGVVRDNAKLNAELAGTIALGRVGLPDDIGGAVASLLSGNFDWITGQRIEVSGGQNL